jgi:alkaline phosphatase D
MASLSRRDLLRAAVAAGGLGAVWPLIGGLAPREALAQAELIGIRFDPAPFTLGVASGDPRADGVTLWTRLAPEPLTGGGLDDVGPVEVGWVVAEDPQLRRVVRSGTAAARPEDGHAVHLEVAGLDPGTTYFYAFAASGRRSRTGRTRTAPAGPVDRLRFAWVSCANLPAGSFASYANLAREDLDLVVCLGDYIYEGGGSGSGRDHTGGETVTLADYRNRHALYKGDPALRAAHAAHPWVVTWDDHEVDNNYANLIPENDAAAEGNDSPERFADRRAAAYRAYYEHLPISLAVGGATAPDGPDFRIHRELAFGDLLDLTVLDTRQYRDDQACDDTPFGGVCGAVDDPARTMLGAPQRGWLLDRLATGSAAWHCIANGVMWAPWQVRPGLPEDLPGLDLLPVDDGHAVNPDQWDGYQAERTALLQAIADDPRQDVVVITGDLHSSWVADLTPDFDDPTAPAVATEFVGTSVTSGFPVPDTEGSGFRAATLATNPHLRDFDGDLRGYVVAEITGDAWRSRFMHVGDAQDPTRRAAVRKVWRVDRGSPGAVQEA